MLNPEIEQAPPKTRGIPIIGSSIQLFQENIDYLLDAREKFGDVYILDLGLLKVYALNHPNHAQLMFLDNVRNYGKGGAMWDSMKTLAGNGLPMSEGEFWLRQRRMMQPHFHPKRIQNMTNLMIEEVHEELKVWEQYSKTQESFDISEAFTRITMRVIVRAVFGTALDTHEMDKVGTEIAYVLGYMIQGAITNSIPHWLPVPGRKRYQQALNVIDSTIFRIIQESRKKQRDGDDLISLLLDMVDDESGEQMTNEQLRDEAVSLFVAGYETTSVNLAWAIDILLNHSGIYQILLNEIDTVNGNSSFTFESLMKMQNLRLFIKEVTRFKTTSWLIPRTTVEDEVVDGYLIPAGATVFYMNYVAHHHPEIWDEPDKFDLYRFTPERVKKRHKFAWMPFGVGQHQCLGKDFALMEMQVVIAMLLRKFRIERVAGHIPIPSLSITLRPKNGVQVRLKDR